MSSTKNLKIVAFVDGAARGNPGPASAGIVLQDVSGKAIKSFSVFLGPNTNNIAEYSALILALQESLILGAKEVQIYTDSELVTKQFNGQYKIKEPTLKALYALVMHLKTGFNKVEVTHVPREKNKLADAEANKCLDKLDFFGP